MDRTADRSPPVAAETAHELIIRGFEASMIFGLDLGHLVGKESVAEFNASRGLPGWLEETRQRLTRPEHFGFDPPVYAASAYAQTDRVGRNTFSAYFAYNLLPLVLKVKEPRWYGDDTSRWHVKSFKLGPRGAITAVVNFVIDCESRDGSSVEDVIAAYYRFRNDFRYRAREAFAAFAELWNDSCEPRLVTDLTAERIEGHAHHYDIVDVDVDLSLTGCRLFKDLYEPPYPSALRELAGLSRMARRESWRHYYAPRLAAFVAADIGNRDDEIWVLNDERLIRSHPDRGSNVYVDSFCADVALGLEVLVQQEISVHYLYAWLSAERARLRAARVENAAASTAMTEARAAFQELAHIADLLVDPAVLQRNVKHSYYNTVMARATEALGLDRFTSKVRASVNELFTLRDAMLVHQFTAASFEIQRADLTVSAALRRLTRGTYVLTIVIVVLMLVQVGVAIYLANN